MSRCKNKKGAGADLLLEIIISSILFFVIVLILFGIQAPVMKLNAAAHVVSADAALGCELSLTNLLKADSPNSDVTYSDWLVNSYLTGNQTELNYWTGNVTSIFTKTFDSGYWNLSITLPNGTNITPLLGEITHGTKYDVFNCKTFVPYSAAYTQYYCYPEIPPQEATNGETRTFRTPDGDISCTFIINDKKIGIEPTTCSLDLYQSQKSIFADDLVSYIDNDDSTLNVLALPLLIDKRIPYEITVQETEEASKVAVSLVKRALIEDCALHLTLMTTNISADGTLSAATP